MALSEQFFERAQALIARYPEGRSRSALLPLLFLAQSEEGHVTADAQGAIGDLLGLTKAEVAAVSTFYTMFKRTPQGRWLVSVCTQPSCALAGGSAIKERLEQELGIACGATTTNGAVSLEEVECLCACDGAPVVSVNYENYEKMDVEQVVEMVKSLAGGAAPPPAARGDVPEPFDAVNRRLSGIEAPR